MAEEPRPMMAPLVHSMMFCFCLCCLGSVSEYRVFGLMLRPLYNNELWAHFEFLVKRVVSLVGLLNNEL